MTDADGDPAWETFTPVIFGGPNNLMITVFRGTNLIAININSRIKEGAMTDLKGKTLFITGASRGIGKAIALRAAKDGACVAIAAKTTEPHPKLTGTIYYDSGLA